MDRGETSSTNRRIAKNTLLLYFRMLFLMVISLWTSRIVLAALGVEDYGIYNVVGGVVALFTGISASLITSITRFITYEIGRGAGGRLGIVFSTSVTIQALIALCFLVIAETVGVWFVNTHLQIPDGRMVAAHWMLQCSIAMFVINLMSVPYNAMIVSNEKMAAFAYISILEAVLKFGIAYAMLLSVGDKLVLYGLLLTAATLLIRGVYGMYSSRHFPEARFRLVWDRALFREMLSFSGWNFLGNSTYVVNTQGVNILINLYFGVAMNAVRGIAVQANNALMGFVNNFTMALNPQITKQYAAGNWDYMFRLVNQGTKFSAYIMLLYLIPFELETQEILSLWLKEVPEDTAVFVRLVFVATLCQVVGNELYYAILATGRIRRYQIVFTVVTLSIFVLSWIAYVCGMAASVTFVIQAVVGIIVVFVRLAFLKRMIGFRVRRFLREALLPIVVVTATAFIVPTVEVMLIEEGILRCLLVTVTGIATTAAAAYLLGLTPSERSFIRTNLRTMIKKFTAA